MSHFEFTVDTSEMAHSLDRVARHVDGTTTAVVAMQAAVVLAEKKAADAICEHVERGFFGLIRSQITQKIAVCRSQLDARLMEMANQAQGLLGIRQRMERDFQMIATRYGKLFRSLDAALATRITELDKAIVQLRNKEMARVQNRATGAQAHVPIHHVESVSLAQRLAVSQTRASTVRSIERIRSFVGEANQQKALVSSILGPACPEADPTIHLPVAFVEADSLRTAQRQWAFHCPAPAAPVLRRALGSLERDIVADQAGLAWEAPSSGTVEAVQRHFQALVQASGSSERVKARMLELFRGAPWQAPTQGRA